MKKELNGQDGSWKNAVEVHRKHFIFFFSPRVPVFPFSQEQNVKLQHFGETNNYF